MTLTKNRAVAKSLKLLNNPTMYVMILLTTWVILSCLSTAVAGLIYIHNRKGTKTFVRNDKSIVATYVRITGFINAANNVFIYFLINILR